MQEKLENFDMNSNTIRIFSKWNAQYYEIEIRFGQTLKQLLARISHEIFDNIKNGDQHDYSCGKILIPKEASDSIKESQLWYFTLSNQIVVSPKEFPASVSTSFKFLSSGVFWCFDHMQLW